jgi:hypothetical protein
MYKKVRIKIVRLLIYYIAFIQLPVTVAERSKACIVFARSEAGIVGFESHSGHGSLMCVCVFLCLCCPVFRQRPCDELITRPRSPTDCEWWRNWEISPILQKVEQASKWEQRGRKEFIQFIYIYIYIYIKFQDWLNALPNAIICNFYLDIYVSKLITSYPNAKNTSHQRSCHVRTSHFLKTFKSYFPASKLRYCCLVHY